LGIFKHVTINAEHERHEQFMFISAGIDYQFNSDLSKIGEVEKNKDYNKMAEKLIRNDFV
jgi:hypothetical protein